MKRKRHNSLWKNPRTPKQLIAIELGVFIDRIGDVPLEFFSDVREYDETHRTNGEPLVSELEEMCQQFVSDAREKMEQIAREYRINTKGTWL